MQLGLKWGIIIIEEFGGLVMNRILRIVVLFITLFIFVSCEGGAYTLAYGPDVLHETLLLQHEQYDEDMDYEHTDASSDSLAQIMANMDIMDIFDSIDSEINGYDQKEHEQPEEPTEPRRLMALTFDDGPSINTIALMDAFKERGVQATFFLLGQEVDNRPDIALRIHEEGHEIGNHSYNHRDFTRLEAAAIRRQINDTNDAIYRAVGFIPSLLRPPYGATNRTVVNIAAEMDMPIVMWSVDPKDWFYRDAQIIYDNVITHAVEGSIILLHDVREATVDAAVMVVDTLMAEGYEFVTLSEMFAYREAQMEGGLVYRKAPDYVQEEDEEEETETAQYYIIEEVEKDGEQNEYESIE